MTVLEIKGLRKKDSPVHYRTEYHAAALIHFSGQQEEIPVMFSIEHTAMGSIDVAVHIEKQINYPLLPVINHLKTHILDMYSNGKLPE